MTHPIPPDDPDVERVERLAAGDRRAFDELFHAYARRVAGLVRGTLSNPADVEDVLQETWLRVWNNRAKARSEGFRGWLFTIARNAALDTGRKLSRRAVVAEGVPEVADPRSAGPVALLVAAEHEEERAARFRRCLERLSERERRVVTARLGGASYDEICSGQEITQDVAYTLLNQAKRKLSDCVQRAES